ncbi:MerR family transcriptional regulator [Nocardia sp. NPDC050630]|uniref:MerR family transcriptional regulator n=1 Tax=Nocardia sp. NPDC050630 TaxID=3364321 RepID=UPI0037997F4D
MAATVSIGEFARLTNLSVKTLRYYHEVELLEPVAIDAGSGYRRYSVNQVGQAQLIRRLRGLDMPLPEIKAVLTASDTESRDAALRAHLERMEVELRRTQSVVASLRSLLTPAAPLTVEYRSIAAFPALAYVDSVRRDRIGDWCAAAYPLLHETLAAAHIAPAGVEGATYSMEFFENDAGEVVAFVPIQADARIALPSELSIIELPARRFAIAVHSGPFDDFDRTYGALGSHVAEYDTSLAEPIRELYVLGPGEIEDPNAYRTEVCWPIEQGEPQ